MADRPGRARRTVSVKKPPIELLPPLEISGIDEYAKRTSQQVPPSDAQILDEIRHFAMTHDSISENRRAQEAKNRGIDNHQIDMARLAAVDDEAEGRPGHDPWLR